MRTIGRTIALGAAMAGTLDLLSAFVFSGMAGKTPPQVLRSVAGGPFGAWPAAHPLGGAVAGAITHYAIMTAMVTAFVLAAGRWPALTRRPVLAGAAYGLLLYLIMYWVVLPLRWPALFPNPTLWGVTNALFSHIVCVGIPIGLITASGRRS